MEDDASSQFANESTHFNRRKIMQAAKAVTGGNSCEILQLPIEKKRKHDTQLETVEITSEVAFAILSDIEIPVEIYQSILKNLSFKDTINWMMTCSQFKQILTIQKIAAECSTLFSICDLIRDMSEGFEPYCLSNLHYQLKFEGVGELTYILNVYQPTPKELEIIKKNRKELSSDNEEIDSLEGIDLLINSYQAITIYEKIESWKIELSQIDNLEKLNTVLVDFKRKFTHFLLPFSRTNAYSVENMFTLLLPFENEFYFKNITNCFSLEMTFASGSLIYNEHEDCHEKMRNFFRKLANSCSYALLINEDSYLAYLFFQKWKEMFWINGFLKSNEFSGTLKDITFCNIELAIRICDLIKYGDDDQYEDIVNPYSRIVRFLIEGDRGCVVQSQDFSENFDTYAMNDFEDCLQKHHAKDPVVKCKILAGFFFLDYTLSLPPFNAAKIFHKMARLCAQIQDPNNETIKILEDSIFYSVTNNGMKWKHGLIKTVTHLIEFSIEESYVAKNQINFEELKNPDWLNFFLKKFLKFDFDFFDSINDDDLIDELQERENLEVRESLLKCLQRLDELPEDIKMEIVVNFFDGKKDAIENAQERDCDISLPTGIALSCFMKFNFSDENQQKLDPLFQETLQALMDSPAKDALKDIFNRSNQIPYTLRV